MIRYKRGLPVLKQWLADSRDLRELDAAEFRAWLLRRRDQLADDPVFQLRARVRDLRNAHQGALAAADARVEHAQAAYAASEAAEGLDQLEAELHQLGRAVEGLSGAVEEGRADPDKLEAYRARARQVQTAFEHGRERSVERVELDQARSERLALHRSTGLAAVQETLGEAQHASGAASSSRGERFERTSEALLRQAVLGELQVEVAQPVVCLSGVTLGCARGEFDHLLVSQPASEGEPVDVLAMVEAKRNPNDMAHGFRLRQENIAWLVSDMDGFDPAEYKNRHYPTGRFDRSFVHEAEGAYYRFAPESFRRFERDGGAYLKRLWFVTERRPLRGVSSREIQQLYFRIATDPAFNLEVPAAMGEVEAWFRGHLEPEQSPDVVRRYLRPDLAHQILLTDPQTPPESLH